MYQPIRNKNHPYFLSYWDKIRKLFKEPSIDAPCEILFHIAKQFQRRRFLMYQPIRKKNRPLQPCLWTDLDEMSNLYKVPSIDATYQILIHLAKWFQKRWFFMYQPIISQSETRIVHGGHVCWRRQTKWAIFIKYLL